MKVEFDKSFEKWLSKISDKTLLMKIEKAILQIESAQTLEEISNLKKLTGYKNYFRIQIGSHRLGFELIRKSTIRLIIIADRKDIYKRFPQ
jgi:mRNA interferase RelE/StbE